MFQSQVRKSSTTGNCARKRFQGPILAVFLLSVAFQIVVQWNTGIHIVKHENRHSQSGFLDFLEAVKTDTSTTSSAAVNAASSKSRPTRVIYGIMSDGTSDKERNRRQLMRDTFLSYFEKHVDRNLMGQAEYNEKRHWICSLNDLDQGKLEFPEKCRLAYAFVTGANPDPNAPTMLLTFNESYPLSLSPPANATQTDASDCVYLNIKENGKYGKSPTWFGYASNVLQRRGWEKDWDYIYKSDTDNLLNPPSFFRFMDSDVLPENPVRVYGGRPLDYKMCGGDKHDHCSQMVGPIFNGGGCYLLSIDLAKFISDETTFDHLAVKLPHEDMTTGNFVFSHPDEINTIKEPRRGDPYRVHPVKEDDKFLSAWEKMLVKERERLKKHNAASTNR